MYSSGSYGLFTPGGIGKRIGTLKNGQVQRTDSEERLRVYANHLFVCVDQESLGRCVGEIDAKGTAIGLDGQPLFQLVSE